MSLGDGCQRPDHISSYLSADGQRSNLHAMPVLLILGNLIIAAFLTGLIWFVQMVHYPIFHKVPAQQFITFQQAHLATTGQVVAFPMLIELGLSIWLITYKLPGNLQWLNYAALGLVLLIWAVTFFVSVPLHNQLATNGYNWNAVQQLITTNWIRTVAWTVRMGLMAYVLVKFI